MLRVIHTVFFVHRTILKQHLSLALIDDWFHNSDSAEEG